MDLDGGGGGPQQDGDEVVEEFEVVLCKRLADQLQLWQLPPQHGGSGLSPLERVSELRCGAASGAAELSCGDATLRSNGPRRPGATCAVGALRRLPGGGGVLALTHLSAVHRFGPDLHGGSGPPADVWQWGADRSRSPEPWVRFAPDWESEEAVSDCAQRLFPQAAELCAPLAAAPGLRGALRSAAPARGLAAGALSELRRRGFSDQLRGLLRSMQVATFDRVKAVVVSWNTVVPEDMQLVELLSEHAVLVRGLWVSRAAPVGMGHAEAAAREWLLLCLWRGCAAMPGAAAVRFAAATGPPFALALDRDTLRGVLRTVAELIDPSGNASPPPRRRRVDPSGEEAEREAAAVRSRDEAARAVLRLRADGRLGEAEARERELAAFDAELRQCSPGGRLWALRCGGSDADFCRAWPLVSLAHDEAWERRAPRVRHAACSADTPAGVLCLPSGAIPAVPTAPAAAAAADASRPAAGDASSPAAAGEEASSELRAAILQWLHQVMEPRGVVNRALLVNRFRQECEGALLSRGLRPDTTVFHQVLEQACVRFGDSAVVLRELPPSRASDNVNAYRWAYIECFNEMPRRRKRDIDARVAQILQLQGGAKIPASVHARIVDELATRQGLYWTARSGADW